MAREPILLQIPNNLEPWQANNWRKIANAINAYIELDNKVNSPQTGMAASGSKVKINDKDNVADYLDEKLIAGTLLTLTESLTGGLGSKILTADVAFDHTDADDMPDTTGVNVDHDTRYVPKVQAATPTTPTPMKGMIWRDTDAVNNFSLGFAVATDTYTVADEIEAVICNKSSAFTVTLPTASGSGRWLYIKNINTGTVTISKSGDTIDGSASQAIYQWECAALVDYAANSWVII